MIASAMSSAAPAKTSPMLSDGGPQTTEERPAAVVSEMAQAARTGGPHRRHRRHVSTLSRLRSPHASCTVVSTRWPSVRDRGICWIPPESVAQASAIRSSVAPARRMRRMTGRRLKRCPSRPNISRRSGGRPPATQHLHRPNPTHQPRDRRAASARQLRARVRWRIVYPPGDAPRRCVARRGRTPRSSVASEES